MERLCIGQAELGAGAYDFFRELAEPLAQGRRVSQPFIPEE